MKKHRTKTIDVDQVEDMLQRLEHVVLQVLTINPWVEGPLREPVQQLIERVDVVKLQLETL